MQILNTTSRTVAAIMSLLAVTFVFPVSGMAQTIETQAREAIVLDPQTNTVLLNKDGMASMPPASMSKIWLISG